MKKVGYITFLLLGMLQASAQVEQGALAPARVIGPNPEAARIASYGKYDVSYYTGKPQISIPLYSVKTTDLEVPLSLAYEAAGIKTDELASWTGTGWVLTGIGMITRVVVGTPDEAGGGFLGQTIPYTGTIPTDYYYQVAYLHDKDTEPDKYYFNFTGRSGEFTYDTSKNIFQIPVSGLKITRAGDDFEILDEQGNLYEFKVREYTNIMINWDTDYQPRYVSTWWLSKITSADKSDQITFNYAEDAAEEQEYKATYSAVYGPKYTLGGGTIPQQSGNVLDYSSSVMNRTWKPMRISSIDFNNGRVVFNKVSDRTDGGSSRLASMEVYNLVNGTYKKLRSVNFVTDYFHYTGSYKNNLILYSQYDGRNRLKLKNMEELDAQGTLVGKYGFEYNESVELPFRATHQQDYWGYFNGATANDAAQTLLPTQTTDDYIYTVGSADREPNEQYMKAGMLTKILYPTGGYSLFNWEAHKYLYSGTTIVASTTDCIAFGNTSSNEPQPTQTKNLTLAAADNVKITVNISTYPHPSNPPYDNPDYQTLEENTRPNVSLVNLSTGQTLFYYVNNNPAGSVTNISNLSLPAGNYQLISNCYANSTTAYARISVEWHTTQPVNTIKLAGGLRIGSIQRYTADNKFAYQESYKYGESESGYGRLSLLPQYMNTLAYSKPFKYYYLGQGSLSCNFYTTTRKLYKSEPIASLNPASGSSVVYPVVTKYYGDNVNNMGKNIFKYRSVEELDVERFPYGQSGEYMITKYGWRTPLVERTEDYVKNGSTYTLVRQTDNTYTELGSKIFPVIKLGFKNENVSLSCFAPSFDDYYAATYYVQTAITQLTATSVKEFDASGSVSLETSRTFAYDTKYNSFPVNEILTNSKGEDLKTVSRYVFNKDQISGLNTANGQAIDRMVVKNMIASPVEKEVLRGSALMQRNRTNFKIWDGLQNVVKPENMQLQILSNAAETRILFDNYDAAGNLLQQGKDKDVREVYIWGYGSQYPVARIVGTDYNTAKQYINQTMLDNAANYTDDDIRVELDKLRSNLPGAQVTTYTYAPVLGMTSTTEPNGKTRYYEYDSYGRLKLIKDQNGKILQQYDYQYQKPITQ